MPPTLLPTPPPAGNRPTSATKPVHTVVLDAAPILTNSPPVSGLLASADVVVTVPAVLTEIRDETARARVEATLLPFLTLRSPRPASLATVTDFARRTGDLAVLSRPDLLVLALAYELECELNGGDWRLRRVPGQKSLNGAPSARSGAGGSTPDNSGNARGPSDPSDSSLWVASGARGDRGDEEQPADSAGAAAPDNRQAESFAAPRETRTPLPGPGPSPAAQEHNLESLDSSFSQTRISTQEAEYLVADEAAEPDDSDSDGWITPSNIHKHNALDPDGPAQPASEPKTMQVATITTDFAMQNVLLQMNLNLLSPAMQRIRHLKTWVLRCHACFKISKDMTRQFCPSCGGPTLTRVACSTDQNGVFKVHLKKNYQWNNRGNVFSIPKPVSGSASGKLNVGGGGKGGGKGGWGQDLILREDQKEYVQAVQQEKRSKERDLMDEDYLPGILTGDRGRTAGRRGVGAGKDVNSRKR
ncbi:MAG: Nin1 binding protein [Geoglossum umbratile]|nr:MAG: Nin1 binding protein [Geoglossum umbratile]